MYGIRENIWKTYIRKGLIARIHKAFLNFKKMQLKNRQKRGSGQDGMLASFHDHIKIANEI